MPLPSRYITARLTLRKGTTEQWLEQDTVLQAGEPGYDTVQNGLKIGDGVTPWTELKYVRPPEIDGGTEADGSVWTNDGKYFPLFITSSADAIDYTKARMQVHEGSLLDMVELGLTDGSPPLGIFELGVIPSSDLGEVEIANQTRNWGFFDEGDQVEIIATPGIGRQFVGWTGIGDSPNTATTTVTVTENVTITANFS